MKSTSLPDFLRVSGAMLMNLKTQELMHGFESPGTGSTDRDPPSSIGLGTLVGQEGLQTLHVRNAGRNLPVGQNRRGKVSVSTFFGYALRMPAYYFPARCTCIARYFSF